MDIIDETTETQNKVDATNPNGIEKLAAITLGLIAKAQPSFPPSFANQFLQTTQPAIDSLFTTPNPLLTNSINTLNTNSNSTFTSKNIETNESLTSEHPEEHSIESRPTSPLTIGDSNTTPNQSAIQSTASLSINSIDKKQVLFTSASSSTTSAENSINIDTETSNTEFNRNEGLNETTLMHGGTSETKSNSFGEKTNATNEDKEKDADAIPESHSPSTDPLACAQKSREAQIPIVDTLEQISRSYKTEEGKENSCETRNYETLIQSTPELQRPEKSNADLEYETNKDQLTTKKKDYLVQIDTSNIDRVEISPAIGESSNLEPSLDPTFTTTYPEQNLTPREICSNKFFSLESPITPFAHTISSHNIQHRPNESDLLKIDTLKKKKLEDYFTSENINPDLKRNSEVDSQRLSDTIALLLPISNPNKMLTQTPKPISPAYTQYVSPITSTSGHSKQYVQNATEISKSDSIKFNQNKSTPIVQNQYEIEHEPIKIQTQKDPTHQPENIGKATASISATTQAEVENKSRIEKLETKTSHYNKSSTDSKIANNIDHNNETNTKLGITKDDSPDLIVKSFNDVITKTKSINSELNHDKAVNRDPTASERKLHSPLGGPQEPDLTPQKSTAAINRPKTVNAHYPQDSQISADFESDHNIPTLEQKSTDNTRSKNLPLKPTHSMHRKEQQPRASTAITDKRFFPKETQPNPQAKLLVEKPKTPLPILSNTQSGMRKDNKPPIHTSKNGHHQTGKFENTIQQEKIGKSISPSDLFFKNKLPTNTKPKNTISSKISISNNVATNNTKHHISKNLADFVNKLNSKEPILDNETICIDINIKKITISQATTSSSTKTNKKPKPRKETSSFMSLDAVLNERPKY